MTSPPTKNGDLSVTALYTSQTWLWGGLSCAHLFATDESKRVFDATNGALAVAGVWKRNAPSLRHSLVQRHVMIDRLLAESGACQVLELAAGLSRRGAAFSAEPGLRYTEVDLPHVIEKKRALLERTNEGRAVLARPSLRLVAGDVTSAPLTEWVSPGVPLFVIAEGLFMYLDADSQRRLWREVARLFSMAGQGSFVFDLVPACEQPKPGAAGRALGAMMKRFTGGRSFERDDRTRDDVARELREAGLPSVKTLEPADAPSTWALPFKDERTQQLLFVCASPAPAAGAGAGAEA